MPIVVTGSRYLLQVEDQIADTRPTRRTTGRNLLTGDVACRHRDAFWHRDAGPALSASVLAASLPVRMAGAGAWGQRLEPDADPACFWRQILCVLTHLRNVPGIR